MKELLEQCFATVSEISWDSDHAVSMIESDQTIIDFDLLQERYFKFHKSDRPFASMDGLWQIGDEWYFIEFKNGKIDHKTKKNIREKVTASLMTLLDILDETLSYARTHIHFILVYNPARNFSDKQSLQCDEIQDSPSRNYIKARINQFAKRRFVLFGVISYEYIFFKSVHTYHQKEFESFIAHMKQMAVT